jgi:hypothetical protein
MFRSYVHLRDRYGLPVLPIGLYLRVGLDGVGVDVYEEQFWELRPVHFEYLYVGLPALDGLQYVQGANWLGVALAALIRIPKERRVWLGAEALRQIQQAPLSAQQRYLLGDCVQAYLPLDAEQWREFNHLLTTEPYKGVQKMRATWYDQGFEERRRKLLQELLETRFGPLSAAVRERLQSLPAKRLTRLVKAVLTAKSLRELGLED